MSGPRVFGLPHLSEDAVAAFADGVLSAAAANRAQRHCAECAECAGAVRVQREAAMMLRAAQAPSLPSGLLDRLAGLPMSAPLPPPRSGLPTVLGADGTAMFVAHDVHQADLHKADRADLRAADRADLRAADRADLRKADRADLRAADRSDAHRGDAADHAGAYPEVYPDHHGRSAHRRGALPVTVLASAAAVVAAGTFGSHVSTLAAADRPTPAGAANVAGSLAGTRNVAVRVPSPLIGTGSLLAAGRSTTRAARQPVTPLRATAPTSVTVTPARLSVWQSDATPTAGRLRTGLPTVPTGLPTATP